MDGRAGRMRTLITGAEGGIGGRLLEVLALRGECAGLRAAVPTHADALHPARFGVELVAAPLDDVSALRDAVAGCEVVLHCAHDPLRPAVNVVAAQAIASACEEHGVRRLVHVGCASVYEPFRDGVVDEGHLAGAALPGRDDSRLDVERLLLGAASAGLSVVVLQPSVVYGPGAPHWTIGMAGLARRSRIVVPDVEGICNAIYIDDVVAAVLAAATTSEPPPSGGYVITGPDTVTWRRFFGALEESLGANTVVFEAPGTEDEPPSPLAAVRRRAVGAATTALGVARSPALAPVRRRVRSAVGARRTLEIRGALDRANRPVVRPNAREDALYSAHAELRSDRARQVLRFAPAITFDEGSARTAAFLDWARL